MAHGECIHGSEFLTDINGPDSPESCAMCLCDQRDAMTARIAYLEAWQAWAREAAAMFRECRDDNSPWVVLMQGACGRLCPSCAEWLAAHQMPKEPKP